jgi:hypothetical protein
MRNKPGMPDAGARRAQPARMPPDAAATGGASGHAVTILRAFQERCTVAGTLQPTLACESGAAVAAGSCAVLASAVAAGALRCTPDFSTPWNVACAFALL